MFGCLGRIVMLGVLLVVGLVLWLFRDPLLEQVRSRFGEEPTPMTAAEIADQATRKIERLVSGDAGETTTLSEEEVQALLDERLRTFLPEYVLDPAVKLEGANVILSARLPVDQVPELAQELGPAASFLPDTASVTARGQIVPFDSRYVALAFDDVSVAKVPVPKRYIPRLVSKLRREQVDGLPPDALAMPLPSGVRTLYIRDGAVVLVASGARTPAR